MRSLVTTAVIAVTALGGTARADGDSYGLQTTIADGAALATCVAAGVAADATNGTVKTPAVAAIALFWIATPFVHAAHGNPGRAVGSLALRMVVPLTAALIGYRVWPDRQDFHAQEAAGGAALAAGLGIAVLDALVLARRDDEAARRWTPRVAPTSGGMTVGIGGSF